MNVGDLVTLTAARPTVQLVNFGHDPAEGGIVLSKELCIVLEITPAKTSTWGKVKVLGHRGNIGWAEDGLFYVVSKFCKSLRREDS